MTNEEILCVTVLNSWRLVMDRFNKTLSELSDEQLQQQVAPGRNRQLLQNELQQERQLQGGKTLSGPRCDLSRQWPLLQPVDVQ
jgi:hypothetical protein